MAKRKDFVLMADDDMDDKNMLEVLFEERKYDTTIEFVSNGLELICYLDEIKDTHNRHYPNYILLDLNMPKMDGRQALAEIKKNPLYRKIPVIIFSTTNNQVEIKRCYELGANTYVVKPSSYSNLLQTIDVINSYWLKTAEIPSYDDTEK
jgi:two-component system response regulator